MKKDSISRFSNRVENYVKYRPHYPPGIIDFLKKENILNENSVIADIGSGTGISSELFLKNGNTVYGVKPGKEMREAAEKIFGGKSNFVSVNGNAENIYWFVTWENNNVLYSVIDYTENNLIKEKLNELNSILNYKLIVIIFANKGTTKSPL